MKMQVNDNMDFREVHWHYDMLEKRLKEEAASNQEQMGNMTHGR
jgi:hypothetical protein